MSSKCMGWLGCFILCLACNSKDHSRVNPIYEIQEKVTTISNLTYKTIEDRELQLDVYLPSKKLGQEPWHEISSKPVKTLVYYHGGGWVEGDKVSRFLEVLPYLEQGWAVVNVDYRLLDETSLSGCVEDCLDALEWVREHAKEYKFGMENVYLSGESAGGHLAMLVGMMDEKSQQTLFSDTRNTVQVSGIINWFGISDVAKAIAFWDAEGYTKLINQKWEGDIGEYHDLLSPISYVSELTPPIFSVHGDADINVSINQSSQLHEELEKAGAKHKLVVIRGGKHGGFSAEELQSAYNQIWDFLN